MKLKLLTLLTPVLFSCAGFSSAFHRTLDHVHEAGVVAREIGFKYFDDTCRKEAEQCKITGDRECQPLIKCHGDFDKFSTALRGVQMLYIDATIAHSIRKETEAREILDRAVQLLNEVQLQLRRLEVF